MCLIFRGLFFSHNAEIGQVSEPARLRKDQLWMDTKDSRKNNFTFWHLIFKLFLAQKRALKNLVFCLDNGEYLIPAAMAVRNAATGRATVISGSSKA